MASAKLDGNGFRQAWPQALVREAAPNVSCRASAVLPERVRARELIITGRGAGSGSRCAWLHSVSGLLLTHRHKPVRADLELARTHGFEPAAPASDRFCGNPAHLDAPVNTHFRQLLRVARPECSGLRTSFQGGDRAGANGGRSDSAGCRVYSPTISTPAGGVNLKVAAGRTGLRSRLAKRMCVV
jgi:hypothetical protein